MPNPCGKSCDTCPVRETETCGGCEAVLGTVGCDIAACCHEKNHDSCATCTQNTACPLKRTVRSMHRLRAEKAEQEQNRRIRQYENAQLFSKWLPGLFVLSVILYIDELLLNDTLLEGLRWGAWLRLPDEILCILCYGCYAHFVSPLRVIEEKYGKAARFFRISVLLRIPCLPLDFIAHDNPFLTVLSLLLALIAGVLQILALYFTYAAHSDALTELDSRLSGQWETTYKWQIGLLLFLLCSPLLTVLGVLPLLGAIAGLALIAAVIALYVIDILLLILLHRTVRVFRECAAEPQVQ